jgi:hypothetical protein
MRNRGLTSIAVDEVIVWRLLVAGLSSGASHQSFTTSSEGPHSHISTAIGTLPRSGQCRQRDGVPLQRLLEAPLLRNRAVAGASLEGRGDLCAWELDENGKMKLSFLRQLGVTNWIRPPVFRGTAGRRHVDNYFGGSMSTRYVVQLPPLRSER